MLIVETIPISSYGPGSPFPPEYGDWWSPYSHNTILFNCSKDALCLETLLGESYFACGAGSQLHRLLTDNTYFSLLGRSDSQYIWDQLVLLKLLFYGRGHCLAAVHAPSLINQLEGASCRSRSRIVSSPDPLRPRPVGKLEREKRKEGLVNRHTTTRSSAGMLAELIKTSLSKLIAYLWETVSNSGHVYTTSSQVSVDKLGYESLRPEQETVVRDVFAALSTGYGKSLCCACLSYAFDSLVPRPSPSFPSLLVRYCKRREAERGPRNGATFDNREAKKDGFL